MIKALDRPFEDSDRRRAEVSIPSCVKLGLEDFVNEKTKQLFTKFEIDMSFLSSDPDEWNENCHFLDGLKKVKDIQVVNDNAERGVEVCAEAFGLGGGVGPYVLRRRRRRRRQRRSKLRRGADANFGVASSQIPA